MVSSSSATESKAPVRMALLVISGKNLSTRLSHEQEVGTKWRTNLWLSASHA